MTRNSSSTDWKEHRRLQAWTLKRKGWKQKDIATALGVTAGAVSQWVDVADRYGKAALWARPHTGRPPELRPDQLRQIPDLLSHGAEAYGFRGKVWTGPRIRQVVEWEFKVSYHRSHVARLLKELKWTPQMPIERASQRDEAEIAHWRTKVWPELKKRRSWSAGLLCLLTNRASTCCRPVCAAMRRGGIRRSCASSRPATTCR